MVDKNLGIQKERPLGIKLITYFNYLLIGIIAITFVILLTKENSFSELGLEGIGRGIYVILMIIFALAILLISFFAGRGIWNGNKGWRVFVIIISGLVATFRPFSIINSIPNLGTTYSIWNLLYSIFYLFAALFIFGYLILNKEGKNWFKK